MLGGTFDRIVLNDADGAADAGNYEYLWVLNGVFIERLRLRLKIGKGNPRDKHSGFH